MDFETYVKFFYARINWKAFSANSITKLLPKATFVRQLNSNERVDATSIEMIGFW